MWQIIIVTILVNIVVNYGDTLFHYYDYYIADIVAMKIVKIIVIDGRAINHRYYYYIRYYFTIKG